MLESRQRKRERDPDEEVELELQKFELGARLDDLQAFLALVIGGFGVGLYFLAANEVETHLDRALGLLLVFLATSALAFFVYGNEYDKIVEKYRRVLQRQQELRRAHREATDER